MEPTSPSPDKLRLMTLRPYRLHMTRVQLHGDEFWSHEDRGLVGSSRLNWDRNEIKASLSKLRPKVADSTSTIKGESKERIKDTSSNCLARKASPSKERWIKEDFILFWLVCLRRMGGRCQVLIASLFNDFSTLKPT